MGYYMCIKKSIMVTKGNISLNFLDSLYGNLNAQI